MKPTETQGKEELIVTKVQERYGRIARESTSCCGSGSRAPASIQIGYDDKELESIPAEANLGLGCGTPLKALDLKPGEIVCDLGSGGGIDAFLAARLVGSEGKVYGIDMTQEMLERARANAARGGYDNVEFRQGRLEALPLEDASIDAVTSNCVINLVPDKSVVFREIARVLKPGGRLAISDIVLDGRLPEAIEKSVLAYVGCVAGAMERERYFDTVRAAGLEKVQVLSDVDFIGTLGGDIPADAKAILDDAGVGIDELVGKVHSVTFRASKPVR